MREWSASVFFHCSDLKTGILNSWFCLNFSWIWLLNPQTNKNYHASASNTKKGGKESWIELGHRLLDGTPLAGLIALVHQLCVRPMLVGAKLRDCCENLSTSVVKGGHGQCQSQSLHTHTRRVRCGGRLNEMKTIPPNNQTSPLKSIRRGLWDDQLNKLSENNDRNEQSPSRVRF